MTTALALADTLPALDATPAQFARLNVAGLRRMYLLTHANPVAAARELAGVTDPVHVLAVVAPHVIPRAETEYAARQARETERRERERAARERTARFLAGAPDTGAPRAETLATDDDDAPRASHARGDEVTVRGQAGRVVCVVNGACVCKLADGSVVSI